MAFSGNQITRLGASGIPRTLYGSFSGKTKDSVTKEYTVTFSTWSGALHPRPPVDLFGNKKVWVPILSADNDIWSAISTNDSDSWTAISTGDADNWIEIETE